VTTARLPSMQTAANAIQKQMGPEPTENIAEPKWSATRQMKALRWHGKADVRLDTVPAPEVTEDEDVILRITGTTICGSDLHLYQSEIVGLQKGDILGHEFMGIIDAVGPKVKNRKVGDRVVVSFQIACGKCEYCQKKFSSFCDRTNDSSLMQKLYGQRDAGFFGYSHFTGGYAGGQAEYVRVPYGDVNTLPIPEKLCDEDVLFLSDVLPTSYHCVVDTGVEDGDVVAVWGLGPIGLCALKWAKLKGAKRVIGIDRVPARLEKARNLCGAETINFDEVSDIPKKLLEMTNGRGVDVALDCGTFHEPKGMLHKAQKLLMLETDSPETVNECIKSVRKMGRVGVIAAYSLMCNQFLIGPLMEKGVRFIGNGQAPVHKYWEEILGRIQDGSFSAQFMVSHRVPIDDFPALYKAFQARVAGVEKVFVETQFSSPPGKGYPQMTRVADWPTK